MRAAAIEGFGSPAALARRRLPVLEIAPGEVLIVV
jgi:hypothetical protein